MKKILFLSLISCVLSFDVNARNLDRGVLTDLYSDAADFVRSAVASRTKAIRGNVSSSDMNTAVKSGISGYDIKNKTDYISFLKSASNGASSECFERYGAYVNMFNHDSSQSGQITAKSGASASGRMDNVCEFLGYGHWCFALGFAYALRDLNDYVRTSTGNKCYTYSEFCQLNGKQFSETSINDYLSRIIDEIMFYNSDIRNTNKNTVQITTETRSGPSVVRTSGWRTYNTDSWVMERIPNNEMVRLLCK